MIMYLPIKYRITSIHVILNQFESTDSVRKLSLSFTGDFPSLVRTWQLLEFNKSFKHLEHVCKAVCELTALHKGLVSSSRVWTFCLCWGLRLRLMAPECHGGAYIAYIACTLPLVSRIYANLLKTVLNFSTLLWFVASQLLCWLWLQHDFAQGTS